MMSAIAPGGEKSQVGKRSYSTRDGFGRLVFTYSGLAPSRYAASRSVMSSTERISAAWTARSLTARRSMPDASAPNTVSKSVRPSAVARSGRVPQSSSHEAKHVGFNSPRSTSRLCSLATCRRHIRQRSAIKARRPLDAAAPAAFVSRIRSSPEYGLRCDQTDRTRAASIGSGGGPFLGSIWLMSHSKSCDSMEPLACGISCR